MAHISEKVQSSRGIMDLGLVVQALLSIKRPFNSEENYWIQFKGSKLLQKIKMIANTFIVLQCRYNIFKGI